MTIGEDERMVYMYSPGLWDQAAMTGDDETTIHVSEIGEYNFSQC